MPIFTSDPVIVIPPVVEPDEPIFVDTASNYTTEQTYTNFVPFIDGTPQTVDYYNLIVGPNNVIGNSNDINDPTIKQYLEIVNFELRLTDIVTGEINPETNTATISGSANIYPLIAPISGDVFVTMLEEGVNGIFEITTVERYSYFKQSAWKINFTLREYATSEALVELRTFVVATKYFDISRLTSGVNALVTESEEIRLRDKDTFLKTIVNDYYLKYFDSNQQTLIVPYESTSIIAYDPNLVKFFNSIVQESWLFDVEKPKEYVLKSGMINRPHRTIFDAIYNQNEAMLSTVVKQMYLYHTGMFREMFIRFGIFSNLFNALYFPYLKNGVPQITNEIVNTTDLYPYVVSEHFYDLDSTNKTPFDLLVLKLIKKQAISYLEVSQLYNSILTESKMAQFYKIPVIICLTVVSR